MASTEVHYIKYGRLWLSGGTRHRQWRPFEFARPVRRPNSLRGLPEGYTVHTFTLEEPK